MSDNRKSRINWIGKTIFIISCAIFAFGTYILLSNRLLPAKYRWGIIGIALVLQLILGILSFKKMHSKWTRGLTTIFVIFLTCLYGVAGYYTYQSISSLKAISKEDKKEELVFSFVVAKDSPIKDFNDIKNATILAAKSQDDENIKSFLAELKDKKNFSPQISETKDYLTGANEILADKSKALLLNESYMHLLGDQVENFKEKIRVIEPTKLEVEKENIKKDVKQSEPFNVFISGIDTYGEISSVSRSDVNLIMTVNPNTKKILITTVPRDSYVPIAGGGKNQKDKLTHAGIYGINSSVKTLENVFGIDINYYVRINFSSLIKIVDVIGGVDIYNEQAFTSLHGKFQFPIGKIHVDGEKALGYARERYSLRDGDLDRGRNHEKILKAIIEKLMSPSSLLNYTGILDVMMKSSETNMPADKIVELINGQIESGGKWDIKTTEVKGSSRLGLPSYAMPGWKLYMFVLNDNSVKEIKEKIQEVVK